MDEAALKSLIDNLQLRHDALSLWLNVFSAMVAVGVVAEIVFVIREYSDELKDWRAGFAHPPDRPIRMWFWIELLGVALVSIGVAGEFWVDVKSGTLETRIRKANESLVLLLDEKAGAAEKSAQAASLAAGVAETKADGAKQKSEDAVLKAGKANEGIAAANVSLADIQARIAWRSISNLEKDELKDRLADFPNRRVTVSWEANDAEVNSFSLQLVSALKFAGLNVEADPSSIMALPPAQGAILDMMVAGRAKDPFLTQFANALVCSSIARFPIAYIGDGEKITVIVRTRNPASKPPLPIFCISTMQTKP